MALTDNLVSYWKLDESSGNAADSVGSVTLTNNNTVTYSAGKINNAANFVAASSQFLDGGDNIKPAFGSTFSVSFWVNLTTSGAYYLPNRFNGADGGWLIRSTNVNSYRFQVSNASADSLVTNTNSPGWSTGQWHHIVATTSALGTESAMNLYFDGSSVAVTQGGLPTNSVDYTNNSFRLGAASTAAFQYLDGSLDEVGIWTRELTSSEVTQLYNGGAGNQYPFGSAAAVNHWLLMGV